MANVVEVILKASDQTGGVLNKLNTGFQNLTGFSLGAAGAVALVGKAMQAAIDYTKQAIEKNDKYTSTIVDMARFTGDQVEAMSRLVQVADDAFLSQEQLNNAMSIGAKKGLDMSVEGIKKLADKYNSLASSQERAKLLNDNFGRSGLAMGKLLEQGASGIEKNMNAIADNLVVTDKSVSVTYDYKRSVDALNDAMDGLQYQIAQKTMPTLTDFNIIIAHYVEQAGTMDEANRQLRTSLEGMGSSSLISRWADSLQSNVTALENMSMAAKIAVYGIGGVATATEEAAAAFNDYANVYKNVSGLAIDLTQNEKDLATAEADLYNYQKSHKWDTKGIQDRTDAVDKLKQEHQKMVDSWLLNVYTQMLTADGAMSESDMQFLLNYQVATGMMSQENATRAQDYWDMAYSMMDANGELQGSIDALHGKTITITTIYRSLTSGGTKPSVAKSIAEGVASGEGLRHGDTGFARGGSLIVGAGYGYEGFNMGGVATASAGERITIETPAQQREGITKQDIRDLKNALTKSASAPYEIILSMRDQNIRAGR